MSRGCLFLYINTNISMLKINNNLHKTNQIQQKSLDRLSSGLKINSAADDAAGLTISEGMRAQIRGLERAQMNAQDAVSYVQTADGVIQEVTQHVQRMRELTVQSLNDTLTNEDRKQLNEEFNQLKMSISTITEYAQYNGELHSVDQHMPTYSKLEGNRVFNNPIQVIPGWNDRLVIVAEPDEYTITLPQGNFDTIQDLIDQVDTQVYDKYPTIIFDVLPDQTVSIQVENHKDITKVKGTGSFLFYEYEMGNPPGMIVGSTDFSTGNGKIDIFSEINDHLTFYAGATKKFDFKIPTNHPTDPTSYSRDELINLMNAYFELQGEDEIVAEKFGDQYIAISSNKYVITGLSGNMIKIDGISSFLYDISNTGSVSKSNGTYYGSAYLQPGPTEFIKDKNDTLSITLNNQPPVTISLLMEGENTQNLNDEQIVSRINSQLEKAGLNATASLSGKRLKLESEYYGDSSRIIVNNSSSAYKTLFEREETHYFNPSNHKGSRSDAVLTGNYRNRSEITITEQNNEITFMVDNEDYTLTIDVKKYSADDFVTHLNNLLQDENAHLPNDPTLKFVLNNSGGKQAIHLISSQVDILIGFTDTSLNSSAFDTIFGGDRIVTPTYTSGTTSAPIPPPEGTVGESQINKTSAKVTGQINIANGLLIVDGNNTLRFTLNNGNEQTITLQPGEYSEEALLASLNTQLANTPVRAEVTESKLSLVSLELGRDVSFSNVTGFGMERFESIPNDEKTSKVTESAPSVVGHPVLKNETIFINGNNNNISFTYSDKDGEQTIDITVPSDIYSSRANFVAAINAQIQEKLNFFKFDISSTNKIQLIGMENGQGIEFKGMQGSLYDEFFRKQEYTYTGYSFQGTTNRHKETYILGRQALGNKIEIFPNVNEVLTFDIYRNNVVTTVDVIVPPNTYTKSDFTAAFNTALKKGLKNAGLEEDLMRAQIGMDPSKPPVSYDKSDKFILLFNKHDDGRDDSGTYQIQGVRGTAAYTYFYNSQGDPKPSYVIGITDMSKGAVIEAGINDEFTLDIDEVTKNFTIPPGEYSQEKLLDELNRLLNAEGTGIIASYDNNKLKFSNREYGAIPIDGFSGSARDFLFFRTERRDTQSELKFQVGANSGQSIDYNRVRLSDQLLRVNTLSIAHRTGAEKALNRLSMAISSLTEKSGYVGAIENRLDHIIKVNEINAENLVAAESRIRDADIAKEMFNQIKGSLLLQANQAMISHAKIFPEGILQLLKS